jgi:RNA polymerase sigma-70 factor (ECF subfamily)
MISSRYYRVKGSGVSRDSNALPGKGIQSFGSGHPGEGKPPMTAVATAMPTAEQTDVALAARGDTEAFERLYRTHLSRVTSLARWLIGSDDVDDAVQEIFIRVWEKLGTFSGQSAFGTWLHRVAVNHLLRRRQRRALHWSRHTADETALGGVAAPISRPDLKVALESAVGRLPAGAREVFVLHDMEGYTHEEIGTSLGIDSGTSRSQLHRARMLLRGILKS